MTHQITPRIKIVLTGRSSLASRRLMEAAIAEWDGGDLQEGRRFHVDPCLLVVVGDQTIGTRIKEATKCLQEAIIHRVAMIDEQGLVALLEGRGTAHALAEHRVAVVSGQIVPVGNTPPAPRGSKKVESALTKLAGMNPAAASLSDILSDSLESMPLFIPQGMGF